MCEASNFALGALLSQRVGKLSYVEWPHKAKSTFKPRLEALSLMDTHRSTRCTLGSQHVFGRKRLPSFASIDFGQRLLTLFVSILKSHLDLTTYTCIIELDS
ncbi:hypothetical protein CR513_07148, partial [Mucuna pruriens]